MEAPGVGGGDEDIARGRDASGQPNRPAAPQSPLGIPGLGGAILQGLGGRLPGL